MNSPVVLYVSDFPELLKLRKATLESHGCRVKTANTCYAALKLLEDSRFDAVLLDYKPEGMDAEAVAVKIKQRSHDLPIILLSAFDAMPESILWLVDEHVMMSELPEGLVRTLHRLLGSKPGHRRDVA